MMKYLLVLLVVMIAIGIWRNNRRDNTRHTPAATPQRSSTLPRTQAMVTCAHCGLHLPQADAHTQGTHAPAYYCSDDHLRLGPR